MKTITHIAGRRWFERTNGNTYRTATVFYSDGTSQKSPVTYGYDQQYLQTAYDMAGIGEVATTRHTRETLGATYSVSDVARKKDL